MSNYTPTIKDKERFFKYIEKGNKYNCWNWIGSKTRGGYGVFYLDGKLWRCNRVSYYFEFGAIAQGLWVLHYCDNPSCVNPYHLFLGTSKDNVIDMMKKGRGNQCKGLEAAWKAKLNRNKCSKGHPYNAENTLLEVSKCKRGFTRRCRICRRVREKLYV